MAKLPIARHWIRFEVTVDEQEFVRWRSRVSVIDGITGRPVSKFIRSKIGLPTTKTEREIWAYEYRRVKKELEKIIKSKIKK